MDKIKLILIVLVVLIILSAVCSIGGSGLLNNTSHVLVAQSNLEAWKTTRYMAGTINSQSTSLVVAMVVMAVVLLAVVVASALILRAFSRRDQPGSFGSSSAPKFLSLGPDAHERIRRMTPSQRAALLEQLYTVTSWLEQEPQTRSLKRLPVYEKKHSMIDWG